MLGCDIHKNIFENIFEEAKIKNVKKTNLSIIKKINICRDFLKMECVQIRTHGPRSYKPIKLFLEEGETFEECKIPVFIHSSYISLPWTNDSDSIYNHISDQARLGFNLRAAGLILHLPRLISIEKLTACLEKILIVNKNNLGKFDEKDINKCKIIFEHVATSQKLISSAKNEINFIDSSNMVLLCNIIDTLEKKAKSHGKHFLNWGICLDTAHIYCSGIKISDSNILENYLKGMEKYENKISLIHFNGYKGEIGSGKDYHVIPTGKKDVIYTEKNIKLILNFSKKFDIPLIIESNNDTFKEFKDIFTKLNKMILV